MKSNIHRFAVLLVILMSGMVPGSVQAQSVLLEPNNGAAIQLEVLRPSAENHDISNTSFSFYLSGRIAVGSETRLRVELPFINFEEEREYFFGATTESGQAVGNPYLGVDLGNPDNGPQWEFGVRLPVLNESSVAAGVGAITDYTERFEAFVPDLLSATVGVNYHLRTDGGLGMRLRLAPVVWLWVGDSSNANPEIYALYSAQAWYENKNVGIGCALTGRYRSTGEGNGFDEKSLHQIGLYSNFTFGSVMPGFQVRFPLDEYLRDEGLEPTISFSLGFKL